MENLNPNITGYATFVLLGLAWALRLAFRTFWKDKVEVNASAGINDAVTVLRAELDRLDRRVQSLSRNEENFKTERDSLHDQIQKLTHTVNALKALVVDILGHEEATERLRLHGIEIQKSSHGPILFD
jgi:FtsZ-binding cell division protein ZapB